MIEINIPHLTLSQAATEAGIEIWGQEAECLNFPPQTFFPEDSVGVDRAKRICERCPVMRYCLEYALVNNEHDGVWGGKSERERRNMRKRIRNAGVRATQGYIADAQIGEF